MEPWVELTNDGPPATGELEFRVLGRLVVVRAGTEVPLGGRRQRLVLALLISEVGRVVPAERLVDEIWGDARPATGTGPLRTYIWELRRLLGADTDDDADRERQPPGTEVLVSRDAGYLLDLDPRRIDSVRFDVLFADAQTAAASGQYDGALARLDEALGLWRGPAFDDLAGESAIRMEADRLDQLLVEAKELRAELLLATSQDARVIADLGPVVRAHPGRERLWAILMLALYRSGRQGDALRCFQEARAGLVDKMGIEPGPELRALEQAILRQDPALGGQRWLWAGLREHSPVAGHSQTTALVSDRDDGPDDSGQARHSLPDRLTSLVGRTAEREAVAQLLDRSRLVTLTGSGGCGKTRLALAVAGDVLDRFAGGTWFVDLAAVDEPELVSRVLAQSLGVNVGRADRLDQFCRRVSDGRVLLVLDNCEHLIEAVAQITERLLIRCPSLRILATSREQLCLDAEAVWRVPGLSLPPLPAEPGAGPFLDSDAVQLFVERGRAALAGFSPTGASLANVAQICRRLDGIPLAIELAAALVGSLPVTDIAARLDDRLRLLTPGRRSGLPRHRTLQAALDWSYDLLDGPSRVLFARLSAFVGTFSLEAAEFVAAGPDRLAAARGLGELVRTSLVDGESGSDGTQRYRLQETIRQYARDRLESTDEAEEVRRRHARYFADLAEEAERHVHGPAASRWLGRVVLELPNLRTASAWAFAHDDLEVGLRLAGSLHWFMARMALLDEAARWLDTGLALGAEVAPGLQLKALVAASNVAFTRGELNRAGQLGEEGIALARRIDDAHQLMLALMVRGAAAAWAGDLARAEECFVEGDQLTVRLGNDWGRAWMLTCWGAAAQQAGRTERASALVHEALDLFRGLHDQHSQVLPLVHLALFALEDGQVAEAQGLADEAVRIAISVDGREMQHVSLCVQGLVELVAGDMRTARQLLLRSIRDFHGTHTWLVVTRSVESLAALSMAAGEHRHGATLMGYAQQVRERWQLPPSASWSAVLDVCLVQMRDTIGSVDLDLQLARGRAMDLDDALRLAEAATADFADESPRAPAASDPID